jgi:hypothetical protein
VSDHLRLAVDNVSELPVSNLNDIAGMARKFADDLANGAHGDAFRAVMVLQLDDNSIAIFGWGENTTNLELMGLFEAAKLRVFADQIVDDGE